MAKDEKKDDEQRVEGVAQPGADVNAGDNGGGNEGGGASSGAGGDNTPTMTSADLDRETQLGDLGGSNPTSYTSPTSYSAPATTWEDFVNGRDAYRVRTDEEIAQQRKADKRNALFSAIGDGVSALSNLYFTTKGAPAVDMGRGLAEATRRASEAWWKDERLRRQRASEYDLKMRIQQQRMDDAAEKLRIQKDRLELLRQNAATNARKMAEQRERFIMTINNDNNRWYAERLIDIANKLALLKPAEYQQWNTYINARKNGIRGVNPPSNLGFDVEGLMNELEKVMAMPQVYGGYGGYGYGYGGYGQPQQPQQQPQQPQQPQQQPQQPQQQPQQPQQPQQGNAGDGTIGEAELARESAGSSSGAVSNGASYLNNLLQ